MRAHRNVRCHLETRINCYMSTKTWHTLSEMKCIFWAELHVMLVHDHHLFSTPSTTPQFAATAKARLSSTLFCTSTAKGRKAWAATERWLALSVSRPSDNSVQWTSESKVLQRTLQCRASFSKEICFLATNLGMLHKTVSFIATVDPLSKCSTAASSNKTSSHVPNREFNNIWNRTHHLNQFLPQSASLI